MAKLSDFSIQSSENIVPTCKHAIVVRQYLNFQGNFKVINLARAKVANFVSKVKFDCEIYNVIG